MESEDTTKNRLLDAAEELFCRKGFDGTSVRDLTTTAGCNVAAVNYYFGGKDKLYAEMFRRQIEDIIAAEMAAIDEVCARAGAALEDLLVVLITPMLKASYEKQPRGQVMKLLVRDVLGQKTSSLSVVEDFRQRLVRRMIAAIRQFEPQLDERTAELAAYSFDALKLHPFLFMEHYMELIDRLTLDELISHIVRFTCHAIRGLAAQGQEGAR